MAGQWSYASYGSSGNMLFEGGPETLPQGWTYQGAAPDPTLGLRKRGTNIVTSDLTQAARRSSAPDVTDQPIAILGVQTVFTVPTTSNQLLAAQQTPSGYAVLNYFPYLT